MRRFLLLLVLMTGCHAPEPDYSLPGPKVTRTGPTTFEIKMTLEQFSNYIIGWSDIPGTKTYWGTNLIKEVKP